MKKMCLVAVTMTLVLCLACSSNSAVSTQDRDSGVSSSGSSSSGGKTTPESDFTVTLTSDNAGAVITAYNGNAKNVVIPVTIQGLPVRVIGYKRDGIGGIGAFENNNTITSVVIPEGVTSIDFRAFYGSSLSSITLPSTLKTISNAAFMNCAALKSITLPKGLTEIGQSAFSGTGLTSFPNTWPDGLHIANFMFSESNLSGHLVIPERTLFIGQGAFKNTSITSLTLPSTIDTIDDFAFQGCTSLTTVNIPESVKRIAFNDLFIIQRQFEKNGKIDLASQARLRAVGYKGSFN